MEAQGRGLAEPSKGSGELDKGWRKAKAVLALVKASQGFATLRDMISEDAMIDSSRLALSSALGEGAFAHVALGTLDGKRQVAIKSLKPELLNSPEEVTLFLAENEVLRKVKHRNIIELIGMGGAKGEDGNLVELFIVQEYCPGGSLRDLVFQQMISPRRLLYSHKDALRWACGLAKALSYLHRANPKVIHRDLKLDNVLLNQKDTEKAESKLADFGLAKLVDMRRQRSFSTLDPDM